MIEKMSDASRMELICPRVRDADDLDSVQWTELQKVVRSFRESLAHGEPMAIEEFLRVARPAIRDCLMIELIHEEIEYSLKAGRYVSVGSYLDRFPGLAEDSRTVVELEEAAERILLQDRSESSRNLGQPTNPSRPDRYELRDFLGRGSFADVYRAWDRTLGREVAFKRPRMGWTAIPEATERFLREARGTAVLSHPNIVPVYGTGEADGEPYLVTALVEGTTLADVLAENRPSFRQSARWILQLSDALDHAHQNGVIHRDVKPSNIMIDGKRHALLTDFGLAKTACTEVLISPEGQVIGTPAYMSPEQARSENETIDARTDIYSLGVVLYELLTRVRPFRGSARMLLAMIQEEEPTPPRRFDATIPSELERICLKCMRKEPSERYPSASILADDLSRFLAAEPIEPWSIQSMHRLSTWGGRRRAIAKLVSSQLSSGLGLARNWIRKLDGRTGALEKTRLPLLSACGRPTSGFRAKATVRAKRGSR